MAEYIDYGRPGQWQERPPIQVRAREPAMPPRPIDELADPNTSIYRLRQLATQRGYNITGQHYNALDYLELTARAA